MNLYELMVKAEKLQCPFCKNNEYQYDIMRQRGKYMIIKKCKCDSICVIKEKEKIKKL